eukprot:3467181-Rhodomonas_salina.1
MDGWRPICAEMCGEQGPKHAEMNFTPSHLPHRALSSKTHTLTTSPPFPSLSCSRCSLPARALVLLPTPSERELCQHVRSHCGARTRARTRSDAAETGVLLASQKRLEPRRLLLVHRRLRRRGDLFGTRCVDVSDRTARMRAGVCDLGKEGAKKGCNGRRHSWSVAHGKGPGTGEGGWWERKEHQRRCGCL